MPSASGDLPILLIRGTSSSFRGQTSSNPLAGSSQKSERPAKSWITSCGRHFCCYI